MRQYPVAISSHAFHIRSLQLLCLLHLSPPRSIFQTFVLIERVLLLFSSRFSAFLRTIFDIHPLEFCMTKTHAKPIAVFLPWSGMAVKPNMSFFFLPWVALGFRVSPMAAEFLVVFGASIGSNIQVATPNYFKIWTRLLKGNLTDLQILLQKGHFSRISFKYP